MKLTDYADNKVMLAKDFWFKLKGRGWSENWRIYLNGRTL